MDAGQRGLPHAVRAYLLFEGFHLLDLHQRAMQQAAWPRWRFYIRPVGAFFWWLGVVENLILSSPDSSPALFVLATVQAAIVLTCLAIGFAGYVRVSRATRATRAPVTR